MKRGVYRAFFIEFTPLGRAVIPLPLGNYSHINFFV